MAANFDILIADDSSKSSRTRIYVNPRTKIKEVKEKLKGLKEDGSTFSLFKDNNKLEDDATIHSCNIRKRDVLWLKSTEGQD